MKGYFGLLPLGAMLVVGACMTTLKTSVWAQAEEPVTQGTYFTFRMELLKKRLNVSPTQQQQLKHMVEQETSELLEYVCNPATSRKEKLGQFRGVLTNSEFIMRPILTREQYAQVHELHDKMLQQVMSRKSPEGCSWEYWAREYWGRQVAYK